MCKIEDWSTKNIDDHFTAPANNESFDSKTVTAMKAVPSLFDAVDALGRRNLERIRKSRKDVELRTEETNHGNVADMAAKYHSSNASAGRLYCWRKLLFQELERFFGLYGSNEKRRNLIWDNVLHENVLHIIFTFKSNDIYIINYKNWFMKII